MTTRMLQEIAVRPRVDLPILRLPAVSRGLYTGPYGRHGRSATRMREMQTPSHHVGTNNWKRLTLPIDTFVRLAAC
jgi:hypothetical protein